MTASRYPQTTGLQAWTVALGSQVRAARDQLSDREWSWLADVVRGVIDDERGPMLPALWHVLVEGAVDRFVGRPRTANPYCARTATRCHAYWNAGYDDAGELLALRGQEEAARWLAA